MDISIRIKVDFCEKMSKGIIEIYIEYTLYYFSFDKKRLVKFKWQGN